MMTLTIEIPALDRLCAWLETRDKSQMAQQIEDEIVAKLKEAAEGGAPRPEFREVKDDQDNPWKGDAASEPRKAPQEPPKAKADKKPAEKPEPAREAPKPATLADIQKAAAQMRDDGRLQEVKDLFPEYGIKKLSDLKADQLQAFADRLRGMGARV